MKQTALKRKTGLKRGPSKLKRTALLRPPPGRRKRRQSMPPGMRDQVKRRSGGRCVMCQYRDERPLALVRGHGRKIAHLHHVLAVQHFPEYELVAENLVGLCAECHDEHERWHRRLPIGALPDVTLAWAHSRGGREWSYLQRNYPL